MSQRHVIVTMTVHKIVTETVHDKIVTTYAYIILFAERATMSHIAYPRWRGLKNSCITTSAVATTAIKQHCATDKNATQQMLLSQQVADRCNNFGCNSSHVVVCTG
jgi:hypothetical protein